MDLSDLIDRNAAFTPDKPALHFGACTLSYAELASRIAAMARTLRAEHGVQADDRVAILAANHPDYLVLLYACARLGAMLVPLNWRLAEAELRFILSHAEAKLLLLESGFDGLRCLGEGRQLAGLDYAPEAAPALIMAGGDARGERIDWDVPLLLVYTSGTTGRPKGAVLTQRALLANGVMSQHMHDMTAADHVLTVLPFFHVGGLNIQTTPALHLGATVTIHPRFSPDATLRSFAEERPTLTVLVPATIQALLDHQQWPHTDLSSLRAISTGSTIVPQQQVDAIAKRGVPLLQVYGATETSPIAVYTRLPGDRSRPGSTGLPGLLCEARVVDDAGAELPAGQRGEVEVRGANVLREYWRDRQATDEALHEGWFRTGDIASRDADGQFIVHDRKKNMIKSGGESIYPAEIERVLLSHPDVVEAAVIGVPDPRWQEVPVAFVVPRAGCEISGEALRAFMTTQVARFKLPRQFKFVENLPRNALGKVQHFRLREGI